MVERVKVTRILRDSSATGPVTLTFIPTLVPSDKVISNEEAIYLLPRGENSLGFQHAQWLYKNRLHLKSLWEFLAQGEASIGFSGIVVEIATRSRPFSEIRIPEVARHILLPRNPGEKHGGWDLGVFWRSPYSLRGDTDFIGMAG